MKKWSRLLKWAVVIFGCLAIIIVMFVRPITSYEQQVHAQQVALQPISTLPPEATTTTPTPSPTATTPPSSTPTVIPKVTEQAKAKATVAPEKPLEQPTYLTFGAMGIIGAVYEMHYSGGGTITPPETNGIPTGRFYWIDNYGSGADKKMVTYIIAHLCYDTQDWQCNDGTFPFNQLSNKAPIGASMTVTEKNGVERTCKVTQQVIFGKYSTSEQRAYIWSLGSQYVVLVACFAGDPENENVAVIALCS